MPTQIFGVARRLMHVHKALSAFFFLSSFLSLILVFFSPGSPFFYTHLSGILFTFHHDEAKDTHKNDQKDNNPDCNYTNDRIRVYIFSYQTQAFYN